jgi:cell shape-determining protein MreC
MVNMRTSRQRDTEVAQLKRENQRLRQKLTQAELIIEDKKRPPSATPPP